MKIKGFKDVDKGYKKVVAMLTNGKKPKLMVGILADKGSEQHEDSELSVAEIGSFHEFGLGNNPERSFIRGWADENRDKVSDFLRNECAKAVETKAESFDPVLNRLGLYCQSGIQKRMADGIPPPLTKATIDRKGSTIPLIDTGQLRSSITYKINPDEP